MVSREEFIKGDDVDTILYLIGEEVFEGDVEVTHLVFEESSIHKGAQCESVYKSKRGQKRHITIVHGNEKDSPYPNSLKEVKI